jgi:hypothetical protein
MAKRNAKSYSKFTYDDLSALNLDVILVDLFLNETILPIKPSAHLLETLSEANEVSLDSEKARSEFLIAPILRELQRNNKTVFAVYSGFNFTVDTKRGLQGFCDFLLAKLPLKVIPTTPVIAVVEAKLSGSLSAIIPQCVAEMYAAKIWNKNKEESIQVVHGIITNGENWLFLRYKDETIVEVDKTTYPLAKIEELLGVLQHIVNYYK